MKTPKKSLTRKQSQLFRSLIATAFIANGFFPFVAPAFAEGTKAGIGISNTATAAILILRFHDIETLVVIGFYNS